MTIFEVLLWSVNMTGNGMVRQTMSTPCLRQHYPGAAPRGSRSGAVTRGEGGVIRYAGHLDPGKERRTMTQVNRGQHYR